MKFYKNLPSLLLLSFLISCGDNTTTSPIKDITSIAINESNISVYATGSKVLTSTVYYNDGSTKNGSADMVWDNNGSSVIGTTTALIYPVMNGGDANVTIDYSSKFGDSKLVHVKKLISINYSDLNISDIGTPQVIYFNGNFENNETNVTMQRNLTWSVDSNATINEVNTSQLTLTVDYNVTSIKLTTTLFEYTENSISFEHIFY